MFADNRIEIKPFIALLFVNILYISLLIMNNIEGIFTLWIFALFISFLPAIIKDRKNMIVILAFLIPLEISKLYIPFFQTVKAPDGMFNSVFDLARLFIMFSFIVWFITDLKSFAPIVKHKIAYILLIFIAYYFLSALLLSPSPEKGLIETIRYFIYFLMFNMIVSVIKKEKDYTLILKVLIVVAVILSLEGIAEYIFDYRLWVDKGRRASATFLDPNIFARFLDIVICSLIILRIKKIHIIKPVLMDIALLISVICLFLTISRQGLLMLWFTLFIIAFFFEKKNRNIILLSLILVLLISFPLFKILWESREQVVSMRDMSARPGLIIGGILMFIGSPIYGVGAGGFQYIIIQRYLDLLPWGISGATVSHTHMITVLAELGVIGFVIYCIFLIFVFQQFKLNYRAKDPTLKAFSLVIFAALIIIFIGAQAEGRFFAEPMLWLFLGLHLSLGRIIESRENLQKQTRKKKNGIIMHKNIL